MVGMFSRFYVSRGHRRTQSAVDEREVLAPSLEAATIATAVSIATHSIEIAFEFKPVPHLMEPLDLDRPIPCPLPEPSMLNDGTHGKIWKEQARKPDLRPVVHVAHSSTKSETHTQKPLPVSSRAIAPSISAPEGNILKLLEECNASAM